MQQFETTIDYTRFYLRRSNKNNNNKTKSEEENEKKEKIEDHI